MVKLRKASPTKPSLGIGYTPPSERTSIVSFFSNLKTSSSSSKTSASASPSSSSLKRSSSSDDSRTWMACVVRAEDHPASDPTGRLLLLLDSIRCAYFTESPAVYEFHIFDSLRRIAAVDQGKGRDIKEGVCTIIADGESLGPYLVWLEDKIGEERIQEGQFTSRAYETELITPIITLLAQALEINPQMNPRECIEQIEQADPEVAVFCALVTTQLRKGVITPRYAVETLYDMVDDLETRVRMIFSDETQSRYRTKQFSFFWMLGPNNPAFPIPKALRGGHRQRDRDLQPVIDLLAGGGATAGGKTARDAEGMSDAQRLKSKWQGTL